ncbi:NAD(P)/FAD-dependent oxidoreductase [Nocardioides sp. zg-579]|uniref:NAD(P)/FAD-dependent oxidoreductase n=1 Tax=Nocardioides marmotae TaxID=2663857 RepID=A0A6I3JH79_9ACTN|nr:NAD(P)/FAD-dependent oxidoreductase [Nocardioides marmotae]MCR6033782.1 NAD(P)/FAD-dependent oxidoreductase [Gordonia jinghuaiqii]MTB97440.1 NAD(P)/FAD-dependent oxidoreductase [Nocardioides marmotae]QKE01742.1 NAD(P)/FAD-dependent oxidoreductase [Nocardioides marmotae]
MSTQEQEHEVDLVVIGLGPGGEALATGAARAGLDVVAIDKHLVGGECPYYGCIPSKMMLRAADSLAEARRAGTLAGDVEVTASWAPVARRIREEATDDWDDTVAVRRLADAGATVHHGTARLDGPRRVVVELRDGSTRRYSARRGVVVNPGTRPALPPVPGLAGTPWWTNRDAVRATVAPASLVVLGGGPIGCELAQVFARFGTRVTLLQHNERLLPHDEPEASAVLERVLLDEGVRVVTGVEPRRVAHGAGGFALTLDDEVVHGDRLLVAAGRTPNLDGLGLETVGLDPSARTVRVDERLRAAEGLWVLGDVTGHGAYTHVSMYQSAVALRDVLGQDGPPAAYHAVPHVTFSDPEVAGVGMTEQQARDAGLRVRTGSTPMEQSSRGFVHGPGATGLVKVVEDADRGVLVGASVVGPAGGEVLGALAVAVHAGVPVATLRTMIYAYPTFHRAIESALADLGI